MASSSPGSPSSLDGISARMCDLEHEILENDKKIVQLSGKSELSNWETKQLDYLQDKEMVLRKEKNLLLKTKLVLLEKHAHAQGLILQEAPPSPKRRKLDLPHFQEELLTEKLWDQSPCYLSLLEEFRQMEMRDSCNTLMLVGPKGCGKTCSLELLARHLHAMKKEVYYIDLGKLMDSMSLLEQLVSSPPAELPTLLIDNVQLFQQFHTRYTFSSKVFPNVVAACSPGFKDQDIAQFRKERGDGKVDVLHFRPLNAMESQSLLEYKIPGFCVEDEDDSRSGGQTKSGPTLTRVDFARLVYVTGGVPRYLVKFCEVGHHHSMEYELETQYREVLSCMSDEELCKQIIRIVTERLRPPDPLVRYGIAYVDETNRACIVSPFYIKLTLHYSGLELHIGEKDWQKLEHLAIFTIKFLSCDVVNQHEDTVELPIPTHFFTQKKIGEFPRDGFPEGEVTLIILAPDHPVVDLLLVDCCASDKQVYFIQVSFSKYNFYNKKGKDLTSTKLVNSKSSLSVKDHYLNNLKYKKEYFVYATTEFEHKCRDDECVYFLNLRKRVFNSL